VIPSSDDNIQATAQGDGPAAPSESVLDFSGDIGSAPLPEGLRSVLADPAAVLTGVPEARTDRVRLLAAERFGVSPECVAVGHGETEFLYAVPRALRPRRVVVLAPCRHAYWRANDAVGAECEGILAAESHEFIAESDQIAARLGGVDLAIIGNPNNPTGVALPADVLRALITRFPDTTFLVDESYVEFVPEAMSVTLLGEPLPPNAILLRTPAPLLGLAGLRLGYLIAHPERRALIERAREPRTLDGMTLSAAELLLREPPDLAALRELVVGERERVRDELARQAGLRVFRSLAGFMLLKVTRPGMDAVEIASRLLRRNVLVRNVAAYRGLDAKFLRICVRSPGENDRLLAAFRDAFDQAQWK
jgi:threonine-phosphate decarboxylase